MVIESNKPLNTKPISLAMSYIGLIASMLGGLVLFFFLFSDFQISGLNTLVLAVLVIVTSIIGLVGSVKNTRIFIKGSLRRVASYWAMLLILPSMLLSLSLIVFFPIFALARGCGDLHSETFSPDGKKIARVFVGTGSGVSNGCNSVFVYYTDYPFIRQHVYFSGAYWVFIDDIQDLDIVEWTNDNTLYVTLSDTQVDVDNNPGEVPLLKFILNAF